MPTIVTSTISSVAELMGGSCGMSRPGGIDSSQSCRVPHAAHVREGNLDVDQGAYQAGS
jgi:hypothetical protein